MNNYKIGEHDTRPWGKWQIIDCGDNYCVKRITVLPGEILSLQRHQYRAEHWTITSGIATVTLGKKILTIKQDEHIYIPVGQWHRIENRGKETLIFIEVQTGDNLDESDIERSEDKYGRTGK